MEGWAAKGEIGEMRESKEITYLLKKGVRYG
jgi:hypothetical protein